jgi:hypothetical protein
MYEKGHITKDIAEEEVRHFAGKVPRVKCFKFMRVAEYGAS